MLPLIYFIILNYLQMLKLYPTFNNPDLQKSISFDIYRKHEKINYIKKFPKYKTETIIILYASQENPICHWINSFFHDASAILTISECF